MVERELAGVTPRGELVVSAPYLDEPTSDTEDRPCMACLRRDCPGHFPASTWRFLHDTTNAIHFGSPTDARGLRLRAECGYTYVDMGGGWWQIGMAAHRIASQLTAATLTEEQIYDAAARLVAPLVTCWQALSVPCEERDRARAEIARLLREAGQ